MTKRGRPPHPDVLTPAEWRVVEGVRHGLTNPAIAALCDLTVDAVKFHVSSALGKLGLSSRHQLRGWSGMRNDSALSRVRDHDPSDDWSLGQVSRLTSDLDRMATWLRDVVGLKQILQFETAVFFDCGTTRLYLTKGDPATNSMLYFRVGDIQAEIARLAARDVTIKSAPHRIHVHEDGTEEWMAFVTDPDGGFLGLMSVVAPPPGDRS